MPFSGYRCNTCGASEVQGRIYHGPSCPRSHPTSRALLDLEDWIGSQRAAGHTPSTADELLWLADRLDQCSGTMAAAVERHTLQADTASGQVGAPPVPRAPLHKRLAAMADELAGRAPAEGTDPVLIAGMLGLLGLMRAMADGLADDYRHQRAVDLADAADAERIDR